MKEYDCGFPIKLLCYIGLICYTLLKKTTATRERDRLLCRERAGMGGRGGLRKGSRVRCVACGVLSSRGKGGLLVLLFWRFNFIPNFLFLGCAKIPDSHWDGKTEAPQKPSLNHLSIPCEKSKKMTGVQALSVSKPLKRSAASGGCFFWFFFVFAASFVCVSRPRCAS